MVLPSFILFYAHASVSVRQTKDYQGCSVRLLSPHEDVAIPAHLDRALLPVLCGYNVSLSNST